MGAETATDLAAPQGSRCDFDQRRKCIRIRNIADLVRLYEELELALARTDEVELVRLASTRKKGEGALAVCARRAISLRRFQSVEMRDGSHPAIALPAGRPSTAARPRKRGVFKRRRSLMWKAVAFVLGFAVSFLLIVGGA
jgi:hypothetical protein